MDASMTRIGDVSLLFLEDGHPRRTLTVVDDPRYGIKLLDREHGHSVAPKSQVLGYVSGASEWKAVLVGDAILYRDLLRLRRAGYPVLSHGSQGDDSPYWGMSRITPEDCERLDPSASWPLES